MNRSVEIRRARFDDVESLAALAARTFRDAFAEQNAADDIDAYIRESFSVERLRSELADACNLFLLALPREGAESAGYAKIRTRTADPSVQGPDPVELERLYVDRTAIGRGIGAALMHACLDAARRNGHQTLWLGVWEHNARAIAFYERWGFETSGKHMFRLGSDKQTDLIMERPVCTTMGPRD